MNSRRLEFTNQTEEFEMNGKIEARKASMRHTATLEVQLAYNTMKSVAGVNLANDIESLMKFSGLGEEFLREQIQNLLDNHKNRIEQATTYWKDAGNRVDQATFADEVEVN